MSDALLPRVVALEGCTNLRDLGGYRTDDGRSVRFGRVFRSASLARLTPADLPCLAALGLRTVCDLRGVRESEKAPSVLPRSEAPEIVPLSIEPRVGASLRDMLAREEATGEDVRDLLRIAYTAYATDHLPRYRTLFDLLLREERLPLLFHCSAGKDRTGFGAALLLTALGVPRATVIEDYLATNRIWGRENALPENTPAEVRDALLSAHRPLLEMALDLAAERHGGVDGLLRDGLGLDAARLARLRAMLLD
ncbi:tyrosine-protein phosphatase [Roseomonas sp. NAR14]|uniref:Tyrosine-protein phosphatase n=1 Tax=Roseomonas acroporae TaxID=2937791 RepID=A0A9X1Y8B7_9PROT|nr:tyrosine-protein phosphatase [Roseomonas acroporae]MCK8785346.1 tyrosine-protein phosphatase [Roseomonas acroporae]